MCGAQLEKLASVTLLRLGLALEYSSSLQIQFAQVARARSLTVRSKMWAGGRLVELLCEQVEELIRRHSAFN
jgi:hypothetical protein